jgi:hypothetical protein
MNNICPSCGKGIPLAPKITSRPFLIVKDSLTSLEVSDECFWSSNQRVRNGDAPRRFAQEMAKVGLQLSTFSTTALWMHEPWGSRKTKVDREKYKGCLNFSVANVMSSTEGMKIVLLAGAETAGIFTEYNASDIYGLAGKSDLFSHVPVVMVIPNPDKIYDYQTIGEMRFSLQQLAEQIDILKSYEGVEDGNS